MAKPKLAPTTTDAATTTDQPTQTAPKPKTPEQQAAANRRQAGELKRSAEHLTGDARESLLLRASQLESDADALAPRKSKSSSEPRPQCSATKKDGTACTAKCMEGKDTCTDHRPVRDRFTDEQWDAFQSIPTATIVDALGWGVALRLAKEALGQK